MSRYISMVHWRGREPEPIKGAPFRFRTLHPAPGFKCEEVDRRRRRDTDIPRPPFTLDRVVVVTLAAISGETHKAAPTMEAKW